MSRLMSVAMTVDAVIERRKIATRRKGWAFLHAGDRLTLCRKVQGRKKGEPLDRLVEVEVVDARWESLGLLSHPDTNDPEAVQYAWDEVGREGFPGMNPHDFVRQFFVEAQGMAYDDNVRRVEWRYLDEETVE